MHPDIVQGTPGECSLCNMALEQVPDLFPAHPPGEHDAHPSHASAIARQDTAAGKVLAVRKSAVLDTGRRQVAYRKRKDGAFELVELKLGPLAENRDESGRLVSYYPVLDGLGAGDDVVVQGGFLLDSQRQIEGMPSLLYEGGRSAASLHVGPGGGAAPATGSPAQATPSALPSGHQH
jgi:Cu(I)/Ag(I) efflux system membrane fusion protein